MPIWKVTGADKETGREVMMRTEAQDARAAELKANSAGVMVARVALDDDPPADHIRLEESELSWSEWILAMLFLVAGVLLILGVGAAITTGYGWTPPDRFQSDNAIGATANAMERLQHDVSNRLGAISGMLSAVCGLLCLNLSSMIRLRATLRRLAQLRTP
jgi:hypothetical protein